MPGEPQIGSERRTDDELVEEVRRPVRHLQQTVDRLDQPAHPIVSQPITSLSQMELPRKPSDGRFAHGRGLGRVKERKHDGVKGDADSAIWHGSMSERPECLWRDRQFDIPDADGVGPAVGG